MTLIMDFPSVAGNLIVQIHNLPNCNVSQWHTVGMPLSQNFYHLRSSSHLSLGSNSTPKSNQ